MLFFVIVFWGVAFGLHPFFFYVGVGGGVLGIVVGGVVIFVEWGLFYH